jgi:hypothetical protein
MLLPLTLQNTVAADWKQGIWKNADRPSLLKEVLYRTAERADRLASVNAELAARLEQLGGMTDHLRKAIRETVQ